MWIKRLENKSLLNAAKEFPIIYLSGARQTGKTSLLQYLFPNHEYVTFDSPSLATQAQNSPEHFLSTHSNNLIIDEVQYVPSIFRHLKRIIDEKKRTTNYILTGSQPFKLMEGISESLAGRIAIFQLPTLTYEELKQANLTNSETPYQLMIKGGYPELWAKKTDPTTWITSYITTYLERDVRNILNVQTLTEFDRFLRAAAYRVSNITSFTDISKDIRVTLNTVKNWISVLHKSHQITLVQPYYRNLGKRLTKTPKLYFSDTGLATQLNNINSIALLNKTPILGAIWENLIFTHLQTYIQHINPAPIWYWKTQSGDEIDFLIDRGGTYDLFEIKLKETITPKDLKGIKKFKKLYGEENIHSSTIICQTPHPYELETTNITNLKNLFTHIKKINTY